jgi:hypothetical protein
MQEMERKRAGEQHRDLRIQRDGEQKRFVRRRSRSTSDTLYYLSAVLGAYGRWSKVRRNKKREKEQVCRKNARVQRFRTDLKESALA